MTFGPSVSEVAKGLYGWREHGIVYSDYMTINHYWHDDYRPELFWHKFTPVDTYNEKLEAIHVFKLEKAK